MSRGASARTRRRSARPIQALARGGVERHCQTAFRLILIPPCDLTGPFFGGNSFGSFGSGRRKIVFHQEMREDRAQRSTCCAKGVKGGVMPMNRQQKQI